MNRLLKYVFILSFLCFYLPAKAQNADWVQKMTDKADELFIEEELDEAENVLLQLLEYYKEHNNKEKYLSSIYKLGQVFFLKEDIAGVDSLYSMGEHYSKMEFGISSPQWAVGLTNRAMFEWRNLRLAQAKDLLIQSFDIYKKNRR